MNEPTNRLSITVPDDCHVVVDEHGAHRVIIDDLSPHVPFAFQVGLLELAGIDVGAVVTSLITTHRVALSDAFVVHANVTAKGPFGGESWEHVLAFRSGLFGYVLFQWTLHSPDPEFLVSAVGSCLAEDAETFEPVFRTFLASVSVQPATIPAS